jgi:hypothetical protein
LSPLGRFYAGVILGFLGMLRVSKEDKRDLLSPYLFATQRFGAMAKRSWQERNEGLALSRKQGSHYRFACKCDISTYWFSLRPNEKCSKIRKVKAKWRVA